MGSQKSVLLEKMKLLSSLLVSAALAMECMDELKSCPTLATKCKGVGGSACAALCNLCHLSCGLCEAPSITHFPATVQPMVPVEVTTLDEHGFSAEQLRRVQRASSYNAFPCEKDQQLYQQTGIGYNPKCDENGDYYPVQCETKEYSSGGQSYEACWCADYLDGSKILGSTEYMTAANAEDQKMKMERKCAPSYGYQRYRENLKETQDYGYQQESRVASVTPPCRKTHDEVEKANALVTAQTTVYNRYSRLMDLPECDDSGFFAPMQCSNKSRQCWCTDRNGVERPLTRKSVLTKFSSRPVCQEAAPIKPDNTATQTNLVKPAEPCTNQVNVPGRTKLVCGARGFFSEIQEDHLKRRYCVDTNTGIRLSTHEITFVESDLMFKCILRTTQAPPTMDPIQMIVNQNEAAQQQQQAMQAQMQQMMQQKLQAKMATMDPGKAQLYQQMLGGAVGEVSSSIKYSI